MLARPRSLPLAIALLGLLLTAGCSGELSTSYGAASGHTGRTSINGFGLFHEMFDVAGWRTKRASRLTPRLDQARAIVWTPDATNAPRHLDTWFDDWLAEESGRTLIYVIKDGTLESFYWRSLRPAADPAQRFEYRRRAARRQTAEAAEHLARDEYSVPGWYELRPLERPVPLADLAGPWASGSVADGLPGNLHVEVTQYDSTDGAPTEEDDASSAATATGEEEVPEQFPRGPDDPLQFTPLLTADETPVVFSLHDPDWDGSQAIVVVGPSILTNIALTQPAAREIAWRIIDAAGPAGQVAFITSGPEGLSVRRRGEEAEGPSGMELLTVWPLNVITMHAAAAGIVALLALMPIFGRPRRLPQPSQTDFARHAIALGDLMVKGGDVQYARNQISEYFAVVRGEPESPWVIHKTTSSAGPARDS